MLKVFFFSVLSFFALYGFIHIIGSVFHRFPATAARQLSTPYTVLAVKDCADCIESAIRSIVWHMQSNTDSLPCGYDLVVINLGSDDETSEILDRLANEFESVHPMSKENYISLVSSL